MTTSKPSPENESRNGLWPTPRARDHHAQSEEAALNRKGRYGDNLSTEVLLTTPERMWPTPDARDSQPEGYEAGLRRREKYSTWGLQTAAVHASSLPEGSPVSHFPQPENNRASEMAAISGRNLRELFEKSDPISRFLRTCRESYRWRVALSGYGLTWKQTATKSGRLLYRLQLSAPRTNGTASGLSRTMFQSPMPSDVDGGRTTKGKHRQNETGLRKQAMFGTPMANNKARSAEFAEGRTPNLRELEKREQAMWPTPRHEGFDAGAHRGNPDSLHSAVKMLHTPTSTANQLCPSMVNRDSGSYGHGMLPTPDTSPEKYRLQGESQQSHSLEAQARRGDWGSQPGLKLSAAWVSRLMGYPDGWMDDLPSDPLGRTGKTASPASRRTKKTA